MVRKNSAKQPIGPGKAGTLKRAVFKAGGGKKTLATLRAAPKAQRKMVASTKGLDVKGYAQTVRANKPVPRPSKPQPPKPKKTDGWSGGNTTGRTTRR